MCKAGVSSGAETWPLSVHNAYHHMQHMDNALLSCKTAVLGASEDSSGRLYWINCLLSVE